MRGRAESPQALVDRLSASLERPVLLDDPMLRPVAYSRQWGEIDRVRSESILSRGASSAVRRALVTQGIANAAGVIRTQAVPEIGMAERICAPVRNGRRLLGYIWLLDPHREVDAAALARVNATVRKVAEVLEEGSPDPVADQSAVLDRLCSPLAEDRDAAIEEITERELLPDRPLIVCAIAATAPELDLRNAAGAMVRRLSTGHALVAFLPRFTALVVSRGDPVLAGLGDEEIAAWLQGSGMAVGQSALLARLRDVADGAHQATVALRVALARPAGQAHAAWSALGSERLIAQLPTRVRSDLPPKLAQLLEEEPELATTLAMFLESGGDVKETAEALFLHRSGLYYRLHRIEEQTGLQLKRGEDRLLAHIAVRLAGLEGGAGRN
jgi:hypothetical protein